MNSLVKDTFINYNTGTLIRNSGELPQLYKEILFNVYKYVAETIELDSSKKQWKDLILNSENYDNLKEKIIGCVSDECLACNMILLYHVCPRNFLLTSICSFCRVNPHDKLHEWYNNFVLNNYLLELCMIMYAPFDLNTFGSWTVKYPKVDISGSDKLGNDKSGNETIEESDKSGNETDTLTDKLNNKLNDDTLNNTLTETTEHLITSSLTGGLNNCPDFQTFQQSIFNTLENLMFKENKPSCFNKYSNKINVRQLIHTNHELKNPDKVLDFLGNKLRKFILVNNPNELKINDPTKVLDVMVKIYPYFTGLTHGCDVFDISEKSLSLEEIRSFTLRYPYSTVGYILNTAGYRDGKGQHWVPVLFLNNYLFMLCSQKSDVLELNYGEKIKTFCENNGIKIITNTFLKIQSDDCNCGLYSVLVNLLFILMYYNGNYDVKDENSMIQLASDVVNRIGKDAKGLNSEIFSIKKYLTGIKK